MFGKEIAFTSRLNLWGRIYAFFWGFPQIGPRIRSYHIIKLLKVIPKPVSVLDAGCGMGNYCFYLSKKIPRAKITGIDCDEESIQDANTIQKRLNANNVDFVVGDLLRINFEKCYDLIILIDVLEHIEDDEMAIRNLFNALRSGGNILIHVPQRKILNHFNENIIPQLRHVREEYKKEEFERMLRNVGFEILYVKNTFGCFGTLAYKLEFLVYKKSKLLLKIIFPLLLCLAKIDSAINSKKGNGLLIWARN